MENIEKKYRVPIEMDKEYAKQVGIDPSEITFIMLEGKRTSVYFVEIEDEMLSAAKGLEFERAAKLRDQLLQLRGEAPMKDDMQQRRHRRRERTRKSEH